MINGYYWLAFFLKAVFGLFAISYFMCEPENKMGGIFAGIALGITVTQYLTRL